MTTPSWWLDTDLYDYGIGGLCHFFFFFGDFLVYNFKIVDYDYDYDYDSELYLDIQRRHRCHSIALFSLIFIRIIKKNRKWLPSPGFPPTSGQIPSSSGCSDWLEHVHLSPGSEGIKAETSYMTHMYHGHPKERRRWCIQLLGGKSV